MDDQRRREGSRLAASLFDGGGILLRRKLPARAGCRANGSRPGDTELVDKTQSGAQFALRKAVAQANVLAV